MRPQTKIFKKVSGSRALPVLKINFWLAKLISGLFIDRKPRTKVRKLPFKNLA